MEEIKKLEIGEYVRTKSGIIDKIENYSFGCCVWHCKNGMCIDACNTIGTHLTDIVKHSKNIKDLVEAGDFINGMQVDEFDDEEGTVLGIPIYEDGLFDTLNFYVPIESINIKTILTKEEFESECYRI